MSNEKNRKKPGVLDVRKDYGAVKPQPVYVGKSNQKFTFKVSGDAKKELSIIKQIQGLKYDYEVVNFLIDNYLEGAPDDELTAYKILNKTLSKK